MYRYRWNQGNTLAGQSTVTIQTNGAIVTMQTNTNLTNITLSGGTLTFGAMRLEFQSYTGFMSTNGLDTSINLKLLNGSIVGTTSNQSVNNTINVPLSLNSPIAVDDGTMGTFLMLPAQINGRGASSFQLIPVATGISAQVPFSVSQAGPYPAGIPTTDYVGFLGPNTTVWYDPQTFIVDQFARGPLVATLVARP